MLGQVRGRAVEKDWRLAADARALRLARRLERRFGAMGAGKIERGARLNLDGRALDLSRRDFGAAAPTACVGGSVVSHGGMRPSDAQQGALGPQKRRLVAVSVQRDAP